MVLLIEEPSAGRDRLVRLLKDCGLEVAVADDGPRGLEVVREASPRAEVVILDANAPGMSGEAICGQIRELNPSAHVLLATGYSEKAALSRFADYDITGFLQKPHRPEILVPELQACFEDIGQAQPA